MNMKLTILMASIALSLGSLNVHAVENHIKEALKHAEAAAEASDGKTVAQHAEQAKTHAKTADEHLDAGIKSLESAVEHGNMGHDDMAQKAAKEAVTHIKAAQ